VHGADDVVELGLVQQVREPILAAGDEVRLDADAQVGLVAQEADVVVEVVLRLGAPEGVLPDAQGLAEAVDVLGRSEL
jgi:hypothetical protein